MYPSRRPGCPQRKAAAKASGTTATTSSRKRLRRTGPADFEVDLEAAVSFIGQLKSRFGEGSLELATFLQVLVEYRAGRLTTTNVVETVAVLLREHQDLLESFSFFAPRYRAHVRITAARALYEGVYPEERVVLLQGGESDEQQQQLEDEEGLQPQQQEVVL